MSRRMSALRILFWTITGQLVYLLINNIAKTNNACKTFEDYYTDRDSNENCYYNPDYRLTAPDIILRHEYPLEVHYVTTSDGHILTLFRIPRGRNINTTKPPGKPVLLQHGFISNCAGFVNVGQKSLGFILANEGYDVWLSNFRGTKYSRNHTHLTISDSKYWDFTFHENGIYDLPAIVDYITNLTNQKITYIGFSLGTTAMFIYSSTYPETAAARIELAVSLAPAAFTGDIQSLLRYGIKAWRILHVLRLFSHKLDYPEIFGRYFCGPYPFLTKLCYFPMNFVGGFNYGQLDPETLLSTVNHLIDSLHFKTNLHVVQVSLSNEFKQFDYDAQTNLQVYGTRSPPEYNLSKITVPTYLVRAENDLLIKKENVERLHRSLPKNVNKHDIYVVDNPHFSHMDFLNGKDVVSLLYVHLVEFIKKNSKIYSGD